MVYRHNDMQHLEQLLSASPPSHRKLVITDSLFSMDGMLLICDALSSLNTNSGLSLSVAGLNLSL